MQTLTEEFMKAHGIGAVINCFDESGQKIVYIVDDLEGKRLAMKTFRYASKRDEQEIELLKRFAELPGIPSIIKMGEYGGKPIIFEEYIDAPDLEDIIATYQGDAQRVTNLIKDIIQILGPVWEQKVVHRDLKPKNIKIRPDGTPVILDFGIARDLSVESITETGEMQPMTWNYASPEQYNKDKDSISYRTDFFVLGIIAYTLYFGSHPFGKNQEEVRQKFSNKDNTIGLEDGCILNPFFEATLVIDPSSRPRNVDAVLKTLQ